MSNNAPNNWDPPKEFEDDPRWGRYLLEFDLMSKPLHFRADLHDLMRIDRWIDTIDEEIDADLLKNIDETEKKRRRVLQTGSSEWKRAKEHVELLLKTREEIKSRLRGDPDPKAKPATMKERETAAAQASAERKRPEPVLPKEVAGES